MDQIKTIPINKWTKKYYVDPVFFKSRLEAKSIKYLKNQNYLDFKKISQILKINYNNKNPLGYVLKTQKKIVGFVGTLFSRRKINNKNYIFCNIHTWIVNEAHRISSHLLFDPLIKKRYVITVLSPLDKLCKIFKKIGFNILVMKYRVVFLINFSNFFHQNSFHIEKNLINIKKKLKRKDWKIYQDHSNPSFVKFIIFNRDKKSDFSLIISKIIRKKNYFNVLNILYVSNEKFLKKNWNSINVKIFNEFKVFFCAQYFLKETDCALPNNIALSLNFKKNICVKNLPAKIKFDTLYSETIY